MGTKKESYTGERVGNPQIVKLLTPKGIREWEEIQTKKPVYQVGLNQNKNRKTVGSINERSGRSRRFDFKKKKRGEVTLLATKGCAPDDVAEKRREN